jgi:hypothetical protein
MKNIQSLLTLITVLFSVVIFSGCASTPEKTRTLVGDYQPPDWVNKGGGAFKDAKGKVFYGVGLADGMNNLSLQWTTADDRAIANAATQIKTIVKRLTKDYESITAKNKDTTERENVEKALKILVSQTMEGVRIIDHWEHPGKNVLYALARVELSTLQKQVDTRKELSDESRGAIKKKAEKLYEEMTEEGL